MEIDAFFDKLTYFVVIGLPILGAITVIVAYFCLGSPSNARWEKKIKEIANPIKVEK